MSNQIIIGTQGNQPFAIPDHKVSRKHAVLNIHPNGQYFIVDNGSTNGTFIYDGANFVRLNPNQPYPVSPDTMIQLGPETRFHVRRLLEPRNPGQVAGHVHGAGHPHPQAAQQQRPVQQAQPQPKPQPKKVDISHLRQVSEHYDDEKMKIESKTGMINGLRGCTVVIMMLAGTLTTFFTGEEGDKLMSGIIGFGIAAVLMVVLLWLINSFNKKLIQRRKENEQHYAVKYVCPECHVSFRGKIYENILAERSCPRCKTIFYEKAAEA